MQDVEILGLTEIDPNLECFEIHPDLELLKRPGYLDQSVISAYFHHLSSVYKTQGGDVLLVTPTVSTILADGRNHEAVGFIIESSKLTTKRVVLFAVYESDDDYLGYHWSTLVYDRTKNAFFHLDTVKGVNNAAAEKLYNAVKSYMGRAGEVSSLQSSSSSSKQMNKKMRKKRSVVAAKPVRGDPKPETPAELPVFKECQAPQQESGYDCGLYVLATARALCEHGGDSKADVLSLVSKYVDGSIEVNMRNEVLASLE